MPNLKYKACGFPARLGSQLTGSHTVDIPWPELVSAAITVGRESWAEVFPTWFSFAFRNDLPIRDVEGEFVFFVRRRICKNRRVQ